MRERPTQDMPVNGERARATGICAMCDFKFTNEIVARYPASFAPGGWIYIELRHLDPTALSALEGAGNVAPG
jgi:hypothetical protein